MNNIDILTLIEKINYISKKLAIIQKTKYYFLVLNCDGTIINIEKKINNS